ncbi:hypothetical protein B0T14DRAFT_561391 [Immersiella caudata]|uniref:Uncharacterized protein n=1 Tax=Immersiella caudata TaxID=314043 RepID=A0AA39XHQ5_9PEZI|nr:hypothetical protein B0T14DRAFT_561391 [Immersiella caudata]
MDDSSRMDSILGYFGTIYAKFMLTFIMQEGVIWLLTSECALNFFRSITSLIAASAKGCLNLLRTELTEYIIQDLFIVLITFVVGLVFGSYLGSVAVNLTQTVFRTTVMRTMDPMTTMQALFHCITSLIGPLIRGFPAGRIMALLGLMLGGLSDGGVTYLIAAFFKTLGSVIGALMAILGGVPKLCMITLLLPILVVAVLAIMLSLLWFAHPHTGCTSLFCNLAGTFEQFVTAFRWGGELVLCQDADASVAWSAEMTKVKAEEAEKAASEETVAEKAAAE